MKAKYILLYALLGAAFLGVSLWVWLSRGRHAAAVRAKYRIGGALLSLWALISSCGACSGPGPFVTCYDVAVQTDVVTVTEKDGTIVLSAGGKRRRLCPSSPLEPHVWPASYPGGHLHPYDTPNPGKTLAGFTFTLPAHARKCVEVVLAHDL